MKMIFVGGLLEKPFAGAFKIPGNTDATVSVDVANHKLFFCCRVAKLG